MWSCDWRNRSRPAPRVHLRRRARRFDLRDRLCHENLHRTRTRATRGTEENQSRRTATPDSLPGPRGEIDRRRNHPARSRDSSLGASKRPRQSPAERSEQPVCRLRPRRDASVSRESRDCETADAKYLYSSFGIGLLGYALAQRAGVPYAQLVRTEITGPLKMNDTVFALSPEQQRRVIQGHDAGMEPVDAGLGESGMFTGAVGAKSTVQDLLTYLDANLHPDRYAAADRVTRRDSPRRVCDRPSATRERESEYRGGIQLAV